MPELAVRVVPMPMPLPAESSPAARGEAKRRVRHPGDRARPRLVRLPDADQAHRRGDRGAGATGAALDVHLLVVGAVARELDLESLAREHGVADRVHVVGFLDRSALDAAMAAADLCVNLRYPTAGETSASLLRLLAAGRPTMVSDYAQFTDLPRDCVAHVPVGEGEVEAIAATAATLLANREPARGARAPRPRARPPRARSRRAPPRASSRRATSWRGARRAWQTRPCRRRLRR